MKWKVKLPNIIFTELLKCVFVSESREGPSSKIGPMLGVLHQKNIYKDSAECFKNDTKYYVVFYGCLWLNKYLFSNYLQYKLKIGYEPVVKTHYNIWTIQKWHAPTITQYQSSHFITQNVFTSSQRDNVIHG